MALASTIIFRANTAGTAGNVNGGGYKPGSSGTDFSRQNAAQYDLTGVTTAAADAILLTASAAADMVGNVAKINSGTNFTVGWYEIISVVVGTSITLDRTCTTAAGSAGAVKIGGYLSLGSADDAVFEALAPGNKLYIEKGTYTIDGNVSVANDGTAALPINIVGRDGSDTVAPTGANRPILAFGANTANFLGDYYNFYNLDFTTTAPAGIFVQAGSILRNCKSFNSSATANRAAFSLSGLGSRVIDCEAISTAGDGIDQASGQASHITGCYIHDCGAKGIDLVGTSVRTSITFNIIDNCATGISMGSGSTEIFVQNNTLHGANTPAGTGIDLLATTAIKCTFMNNSISGFVTGVNSAAAVESNFYDYNNFFNNTTNRTNVTAGPNDTALDPAFTDAPNGNFAVGANMKAIAFPGAFPGGLTTGYLDIGAVQRVEPTGGSSGGARVMGAGIVSGG